MGRRFFATWLVVLAVLPFSAPFATCDTTCLFFGSEANDQTPTEIQLSPEADGDALASADIPILPRTSESTTAVTIDHPVPALTSPLLVRSTSDVPLSDRANISTAILRL
jgi:hypothetical protein